MRRFSLLLMLVLAVPVVARPERVVSMNPCVDQILLGVAAPGQIAAISHWSHDPAATSAPLAEARRYPAHFGTAEEVIRHRPDLVILASHTPMATKAALQRMGIAMLEVGVAGSVEQSTRQIRAIGEAVGQRDRADQMVRRIDQALAAARHHGPPQPALVRMASGLVPGKGSLMADLLARTGFQDISADYGLGMWDIAPVDSLALKPPPLLLTDRPDALHPVLARSNIATAQLSRSLLNCAGPTIAVLAQRLAAIRSGMKP